MGDRANVGIRTSNNDIIFLYLHWGGESRHEIVANALSHAMTRDGDESYFTRIFISRVIGDNWDKETGVGIAINELPSSSDGYDIPIYDYVTKGVGIYNEVWDVEGEVVEDTKLEYPRDIYISQYSRLEQYA